MMLLNKLMPLGSLIERSIKIRIETLEQQQNNHQLKSLIERSIKIRIETLYKSDVYIKLDVFNRKIH